MKENNRNEYVREYIKETYKTVKVYIREEDYPAPGQAGAGATMCYI